MSKVFQATPFPAQTSPGHHLRMQNLEICIELAYRPLISRKRVISKPLTLSARII
jgi:hypothetical protein